MATMISGGVTGRANGLGQVHGTLYSTLQLKAFIIDAGATLAAQGGIGGAIEAIAQEIGTTSMLFQSSGTDGKIVMVGDGHALDADILQRRIRHIALVNGYDLTGATVTQATSLFGIA